MTAVRALLCVLLLAPQIAIAGASSAILPPGQPLTRAFLEPLARQALLEAEAGLDIDLAIGDARLEVDLDRRGLPMPNTASQPMRIEIVSARWDRRRGRLELAVTAELASGGRADLRFTGEATLHVAAFAPTRALAKGEIVGAGDLHRIEIDARKRPDDALSDPDQAIGRIARRRLVADRPAREGDFGAPPVVRAGDVVDLRYRAGGLFLEARARVEQDAGMGETTPVANVDTGRKIEAQVIGPGVVRALGSGR